MASLTSVVGIGSSSLTFLGEAIGVSEVFLMLGLPDLVSGVVCALASITRGRGYAHC